MKNLNKIMLVALFLGYGCVSVATDSLKDQTILEKALAEVEKAKELGKVWKQIEAVEVPMAAVASQPIETNGAQELKGVFNLIADSLGGSLCFFINNAMSVGLIDRNRN